MSLTPVLFIDLRADKNLKPAAVELHLGEGEPNTLLSLIEDDRFATFVADFPAIVGADLAARLPPALQLALQNVGCQILADEMTQHSDAPGKPLLSSTAQWLAGNWYLAPPAKAAGQQSASRVLALKLLQRVAADADTCEIEAFFRLDPVLAYHLLRLVNSLGSGNGRYISSFSQAILILGRQQLKRWLNLMLFAASRDDYRSRMLLAHVAVRARRLELLAQACGLDRSSQERAFLGGLFSLLGTLFGMPLSEILSPLKLNAALLDAVLAHEGELGRLLQLVECSEGGDVAGLSHLLDAFGLSVAHFNLISLEAYQWMRGVIREGGADA